MLGKGPTQVSLSKRWISKLKHQTLSSIFSVGASKSMDSRKRDHIIFGEKNNSLWIFSRQGPVGKMGAIFPFVQGIKYLNTWVSHHQWLTRFEADNVPCSEVTDLIFQARRRKSRGFHATIWFGKAFVWKEQPKPKEIG